LGSAKNIRNTTLILNLYMRHNKIFIERQLKTMHCTKQR